MNFLSEREKELLKLSRYKDEAFKKLSPKLFGKSFFADAETEKSNPLYTILLIQPNKKSCLFILKFMVADL